MQPHILIIGGGIGGLALANGLKKHGFSFHVYERDATHDHRRQGYRIRISGEGVDAMQHLLSEQLWAQFKLVSADVRLGPIPEIEADTAEVGQVQFAKGAAPPPIDAASRPYTMDRMLLRQVLLRGIDGHVSYGDKFVRYEEEDQDSVTAVFDNGTRAKGTLIVGADGSKSTVCRQLMHEPKILDVGGCCIYGKTPLSEELVKALEPAVLSRMSSIKDRTRPHHLLSMVLEPITFPNRAEMRLQGLPCPPDYLYWVMAAHPAVMGLPEEGEEGADARSKLLPKPSASESAAALALRITSHWHPTLRPVIEQQTAEETSVLGLTSWPPELPGWPSNPHVTLLGDAAHVMSPAAGSGAVTALRDASRLCRALAEEGQTGEVIAEYERRMRETAGRAIELSFAAGRKIFGQRPWEECKVLPTAQAVS